MVYTVQTIRCSVCALGISAPDDFSIEQTAESGTLGHLANGNTLIIDINHVPPFQSRKKD